MKITVIDSGSQVSLVEWQDAFGLHRGYLPNAQVAPDVVLRVLETTVPYGLDWENMPLTLTADKLAQCLRNRGIWTEQDLQNLDNAKAALSDALGIQIKTLIEFARSTRPPEV
jgi:hypothetical protein